MNSRKNRMVILGFVLSVSLISSVFAVLLTSRCHERSRFGMLNAVCAEILELEPGAEGAVSAALKEYTGKTGVPPADRQVLSEWGYRSGDFFAMTNGQYAGFAAAGFLAGILLFFFAFLYRNRMEERRIRALIGYLEQAYKGNAVLFSSSGEDEFSRLEDEICKTVTSLRYMKDQAVQAKRRFADNLANIAHQLKTPITAISLDVQMMAEKPDRTYTEQIQRQLFRLSRLESSLLTLSRLDAGTLELRREETDVYTLLVLAAEHLQELCSADGTAVDIPDTGETKITADLDWTMEAVTNLMKNCAEHNRGGVVRCSYARNPLYTEILIRDQGEGFAEKDIPHLFERFYRGQNAAPGGIGIGLALAREIVERQNGTIRAENRPEGGACFAIRFYTS